MVRNAVEPDVIKVTIKDKPGDARSERPAPVELCFDALRRFALRQRSLRQLATALGERDRRRRLRRFFTAWRERASAREPRAERKIQLLVSAVAAEQQRAREAQQLREIEREAKRTGQQTLKVARQALSRCDVRTRRSIVHLMREQGCRDESVVEIPRVPSPPGFLTRMEARAEARKQKMKQMDELRKRSREEQRRREEAERRQVEEQQRQQQAQTLKEARRLRKEQEERRRKELERGKRLEQLADGFYKRYLFRRYALQPLTSLVEAKNEDLRRAERHYAERLLARLFSAWRNESLEQQSARLQLAVKFCRHNLLWYAFADWRTFALDAKQKHQVAVDFFEIKLQAKCIGAWHRAHVEAKRTEHEKLVKAVKHHESSLKSNHFNLWKKYMLIADDVKEREHRRVEWRDLIKRFIPENHKLQKDLLDS